MTELETGGKKLFFIGNEMDASVLTEALNQCLMTRTELAKGIEAWSDHDFFSYDEP